MEIISHLELDDCLELVSSCRALHYLRRSCHNRLIPETACPDCCCDEVNLGYGDSPGDSPNPAPWFSPSIPQSAEFLGLDGHMTIARVLADTATGQIPVDRLTFTGVLWATSQAGVNYGCQWVAEGVDPACTSCEPRTATVYSFCGTDDTINVAPIPNDRPDPTVGLCPGEEAEPLGSWEPATAPSDTGRRTLLQVEYVANSFVELESLGMPSCFGKRITFSFDIRTPFSFTDVVEVCEFGPGAETPDDGMDVDRPCRSACVCEAPPAIMDCLRCGRGCECVTELEIPTTEDTANPGALPDRAHACSWSAPLCSKRWSCITPASPYTSAAPIVALDAGSEPLSNVTVTFWRAHPAIQDPATAQGSAVYGVRQPLGAPIQVDVPAGGTIVLDGRSGQADLLCDGEQSAGGLVGSCDGGAPTVPNICCNERVWVVVDTDCFNESPDWSATVGFSGRERLS